MTALLAPKPEGRAPAGPQLRPVPRPRRQMRTVGFVAMVAAVLGLGMVGVLLLTTVLQDQAFRVQARQQEATALANELSDLESQVTEARSVHHLAVSARKLGMRPNPAPALMRLPDGKVTGEPTRVSGGEVPSVRYITEEQAARELEARHEAEAKRKAEAEAKKKEAAEKKAEAEAKKKAEAEAKKKAEAEAKKKAEAESKPKKKGTDQ
ncbi:MAG: hypothetical protein KIT69_00925 [Propionibacteriaceae bacterium]|nr:hypothetical protein [Propionibacteriaceae bacterium]